jgi:uncharacterized protein (DUF305 family)
MNAKILTLFVSLSLAVLISGKDQQRNEKTPMATAISSKTGPDFEAAFLAMMILHHRAAEPMWSMARDKSTNDVIKKMEQKTTPKEKQEIGQMTGWLKEWHNKAPSDFKEPAESKEMMKKDVAPMEKAAGSEFDALFAAKMAEHHQDAIEMAKMAMEKAQHPEVKEFASKLAGAQSKDRQKLLEIAKGR